MEVAYAAGVFDGEGSVGVYRASKPGYHSVKLAVVGTHRPMIEGIANHFGVGLFTTQKRQAIQQAPSGPVYGKQGWRWSVTSRADVSSVGEQLLPYLIEKHEQMEIVLAYCRGEISGEEAERRCKAAKRFSFPMDGFEAYAPRRNTGSFSGENNPAARISADVAREIKMRLATGEGGSSIALDLNVSKHLVSKIKRGKTWVGV